MTREVCDTRREVCDVTREVCDTRREVCDVTRETCNTSCLTHAHLTHTHTDQHQHLSRNSFNRKCTDLEGPVASGSGEHVIDVLGRCGRRHPRDVLALSGHVARELQGDQLVQPSRPGRET